MGAFQFLALYLILLAVFHQPVEGMPEISFFVCPTAMHL